MYLLVVEYYTDRQNFERSYLSFFVVSFLDYFLVVTSRVVSLRILQHVRWNLPFGRLSRNNMKIKSQCKSSL